MKYILPTVLGMLLFSCAGNQPAEEREIIEEVSEAEVPEVVEETMDKKAMAKDIDTFRSDVESLLEQLEKTELSTDDLRGQIAQKWSAIHFYSKDGSLMRVKTYPHDAVSKRTEEFYFQNGKLVLSVIEDDGDGERGKSNEELSKLYYYHEGEPFHEIDNSAEKEYSIRESDAERLLQEAKEYLEMFSNI